MFSVPETLPRIFLTSPQFIFRPVKKVLLFSHLKAKKVGDQVDSLAQSHGSKTRLCWSSWIGLASELTSLLWPLSSIWTQLTSHRGNSVLWPKIAHLHRPVHRNVSRQVFKANGSPIQLSGTKPYVWWWAVGHPWIRKTTHWAEKNVWGVPCKERDHWR